MQENWDKVKILLGQRARVNQDAPRLFAIARDKIGAMRTERDVDDAIEAVEEIRTFLMNRASALDMLRGRLIAAKVMMMEEKSVGRLGESKDQVDRQA